jgi:hypothetical protein
VQAEQTVLVVELQADDLYVVPATQELQPLQTVLEEGVQAVLA